jgi:glycosyltransferase involved in cell wall biosynthesis
MVGGHETGNETYVRGLVDGFSELDGECELYVYHVGSPWPIEPRNSRLRRLIGTSSWVRLAADLPLRTLRDGLDVLHTTYTAAFWSRCPKVVTVHDISYAFHPEWFSARDLRVLSRMVPWSMRRAARVITVSDMCRDQIIERYGVPGEKVACIPNAAGPAAAPLEDDTARALISKRGLDPDRPYVLAVGNLQPRKNLGRLIEATGNLVASGFDVDLVVAGPKHYRGDDVLSSARKVGDRVRFTGYLSDRELAAFYTRASVFAFPSLFEGFGIPALEAMAHGVPVACSKAGALPQVCGAAAEYFDPYDVDAITGALRRVLTDSGRRAELVRAGYARQREFTWRRSAEMTLNVYREVARPR